MLNTISHYLRLFKQERANRRRLKKEEDEFRIAHHRTLQLKGDLIREYQQLLISPNENTLSFQGVRAVLGSELPLGEDAYREPMAKIRQVLLEHNADHIYGWLSGRLWLLSLEHNVYPLSRLDRQDISVREVANRLIRRVTFLYPTAARQVSTAQWLIFYHIDNDITLEDAVGICLDIVSEILERELHRRLFPTTVQGTPS